MFPTEIRTLGSGLCVAVATVANAVNSKVQSPASSQCNNVTMCTFYLYICTAGVVSTCTSVLQVYLPVPLYCRCTPVCWGSSASTARSGCTAGWASWWRCTAPGSSPTIGQILHFPYHRIICVSKYSKYLHTDNLVLVGEKYRVISEDSTWIWIMEQQLSGCW